MATPPGARFRGELANHEPLAIVGAVNAYCAIMAECLGHGALDLSGAGVANASQGLPDLAPTEHGDQRAVIDTMQTREALYDYLHYHAWEQRPDDLAARRGPNEGDTRE